MKARQLWTAVLGLLLLQGLGAYAAGDLVGRQLRDEARMWESKDRDDLAAEAWSRLLLGDPQHGEAMVSMGMINFRSGDIAGARQWYARASRLRTAPLELGKLAGALASAQPDDVQPAPAPVVASPVVASKPVRERKPRKKAAVEKDTAAVATPKPPPKAAALSSPPVQASPQVVPVVPTTAAPPTAVVTPVAPVVTPVPVAPAQEPAPPKPRPSKALPYFPPL